MGFSRIKLNHQRRALIVTCPVLGTPNELKHCQNDGVRMKKYLMSDYGGAWQKNEIILLNDVTKTDLENTIIKLIALELDYFFFYFSGHGKVEGGQDTIHLNGTPIYAYKTIPKVAKKDVYITDSCREVFDYEQSAQLGDLGLHGMEVDKLQPSKNPEIMNTYFWKQVNTGRTYVHSCSNKQRSIEDPILNGGLFTTFLLDESISFRKNGIINGNYFEKILIKVQKRMVNYIAKNHPTHKQNINFDGALDIPFVLPVLKQYFL